MRGVIKGRAIAKVPSQDFDAFYRSEREKWGKVIKETGMDKD